MDVQTLTIKLAADVAEFTSRIKGVEGLLADATGRMKNSVSGLWTTLGAGVSVAGLSMFVRAAINAADEVSKLAQRTGLAVEQVGGLQLAFQQAGAGDKFAESMAKMAKAIADGNPALAAMGINAKNTDGTLRGTREVLADVATKFEGYADGTAKVAIAQALLGESGAILIPLLNGGGAALDEYDKTAQRLGLTLDTETAKAAEKFNDTLDLVAQGTQGVARGVAAQLLPTLNSLAESYLTSSTSGDRLAKTSEFLANILKGLYIGAVAVVEVFSTLGKSFGAVVGAFVAAARGEFSEAWAILKEGGADIAKGWTDTAKQMSDAWSGAGGATVAAVVEAGAAAKKQAPNVKALGDAAKAAAKALEEQRKEQEAQAKLVAELAGVQGDYLVSLTRLQAQRDAGNLSEAQYIELVTALIAKQPMAKKLMDETAQATANLAAQQNQAFDDYFERLEKERLATEARIKTGRTTLEQLQFENSLLGLNTQEREIAMAMRELERQGVVRGTEAWNAYADAIKGAIIDRESAREAISLWASIESTAKGVWTSVTEQGQNAWKRIGQTLKSAVLDLLWQITGRQWLISIGAAAGVPGAAMAASTGASALSTAGTAASVINAGSTIGTMLGVAGQGISSFTTAVTAGVQSMVGITGTTAQMTASLQAAGYWTGSATSTAVTTAGAQAGSSVMAAAPYAAAAVAALYALGAFRTTKTVGSGLMGTLGEADGITSYDLRRKSGTLFTGPDYSIRDNGVAAQNAALQGAFSAMKAGALQVADAFGLSADTVADFTYRIGNELINPDTGGYGLKLEGLTEAQVQEKTSAALAQANDAIAAQILTVGDAVRTDLLPWMQRIADASGPTAATLQAIAEYPNKLLEVAGTSRDALVQTFAQGLMTGDAQTAGQSVANQLVASIEASLMGNASAQIFDIINRGIVTPMIDALITGQSVTEALSQASIDAVVAKATAAAKTMGALFGSAEFQAAMDAIRSSVGSALGTAGAGLAYTPQYQLPATTVATAADSANDLGATVDDLAKKFASARDSLTETAQSLQVDLLRALGDESGARAAERAAYLAGFTDLGQAEQDRLGVLYDQNQAIRDQINEIQKTKDAVEAARTGLVAYRAALVGTIDLAAGEVDGVLTALEKSAAKDRKALETSRTASQSLVQDVTRVFDRLQSAVDSLFDSTASTQQWQAAQGQQYIRDALTAARLTGAMPDAEDLARAIAAATSGLDATQYGTQAEADYARLVLANELRDLQDISGDQLSEAQRMLTVAEDQLTALDDSLQAYRDQIDVMRGVQQYTGTTAELMARLVAAMEAERGLRASTAAKTLIGTGQAIYDLKTGNGVNAAGAAFNGAELAQAARDALAAGATGQSIYYAIQGSGFSLAQAETILGATPGSLAKEAAAMGLPSFDVGINRVPRDMTARIHADEAVLPAPFNPWAGGTLPGFGGADQTALIAEVRALRTQNEQLEARLASMETNTRRTADSLERVTQNNALTVSAAPVF